MDGLIRLDSFVDSFDLTVNSFLDDLIVDSFDSFDSFEILLPFLFVILFFYHDTSACRGEQQQSLLIFIGISILCVAAHPEQ